MPLPVKKKSSIATDTGQHKVEATSTNIVSLIQYCVVWSIGILLSNIPFSILYINIIRYISHIYDLYLDIVPAI